MPFRSPSFGVTALPLRDKAVLQYSTSISKTLNLEEKVMTSLQQNWYRKLLLSYFPIFLITITFIVFLSFIMFNKASREEAAKANGISTRFLWKTLTAPSMRLR